MEPEKVKPSLNYPITILSVVTGVLVASIYFYVAKPLYQSTSKVVSPVTAMKSGSVTLFDNAESVFTEEIKNKQFLTKALENNTGLITTFIECDYKISPANYTFPYEIKYNTIGNKSFPQQSFTIQETDENTYSLISNIYGFERIKTGKFNEELIDNNLALIITKKKKAPYKAEGLFTNSSYHFNIHSPASKADEMLSENNSLEVTDQNGILKISVETEHPEASANITNAIATFYVKSKSEFNASGDVVTSNIEAITSQIVAAENEITQYKRQHQITNIESETEKSLALINELKLQKTTYEVQLAALNNLTNYLRKNREINNSQVEYGIINDPAFTENLTRLNQLYESKAAGTSPSVTDQEIETLKSLIAERILNTRKKTAVQIDKISEAISAAQITASRLPEQANTLLALERKMQLNKKVYDLMIEQKAASIVNGVVPGNGTKIITTATTPISPIWPSLEWIMLAGAVTGLITGIILSKIYNSFKQPKVNSRSEISEISKLPFIATIGDKKHQLNNLSVVSNLCTAVLMKSEVKIISVTSSNIQEGKTFVATQLAKALAAIDKKVLILDMNLHHASVASKLNITPENTLSNVLQGTCDIHDAISLTSYPNLEVLTAGEMTSGINTFLSSLKKEEVIKTLKKHYDYIVVDNSEAETSVDAVAMMKISDLNLYVVRANTTRKNSLITAERIKSDYQINDIYLILNNITTQTTTQAKTGRRDRSINIQRNTQPKQTFVPQVLKKIALWFY